MATIRKYLVKYSTGNVDTYFDDDQMKSLVDQFKHYIAMESGTTDKAIGTDTRSVDDAHDDQGNPGIKFSKT